MRTHPYVIGLPRSSTGSGRPRSWRSPRCGRTEPCAPRPRSGSSGSATTGTPRSYRGRGGGWFRSVLERPEGRIRAGGLTREVAFQEPDDADHDAIDHAYQAKYAPYASSYVDPMLSPDATAATLRLVPR